MSARKGRRSPRRKPVQAAVASFDTIMCVLDWAMERALEERARKFDPTKQMTARQVAVFAAGGGLTAGRN